MARRVGRDVHALLSEDDLPLEQKLRLLGVRASGLSSGNAVQEVRESEQGELPLGP